MSGPTCPAWPCLKYDPSNESMDTGPSLEYNNKSPDIILVIGADCLESMQVTQDFSR